MVVKFVNYSAFFYKRRIKMSFLMTFIFKEGRAPNKRTFLKFFKFNNKHQEKKDTYFIFQKLILNKIVGAFTF